MYDGSRDYGTKVILTSHDMKDIEEVCSRVILIDKGFIVLDYPVHELQPPYYKAAVVKVNLNERNRLLNI